MLLQIVALEFVYKLKAEGGKPATVRHSQVVFGGKWLFIFWDTHNCSLHFFNVMQADVNDHRRRQEWKGEITSLTFPIFHSFILSVLHSSSSYSINASIHLIPHSITSHHWMLLPSVHPLNLTLIPSTLSSRHFPSSLPFSLCSGCQRYFWVGKMIKQHSVIKRKYAKYFNFLKCSVCCAVLNTTTKD